MSDILTLLEEPCLQMVVGGLADAELIPITLEARETISTPFEVKLEFVSDTPRLDADAFLYRPVLVTVQRHAPTPRYFHGAARRFTSLGPDGRGNWHYTIEIVPQIWFMTQAENCRFFENLSVKDIVSTLLTDIGVLFSFRLVEVPAVREYTVQYNETDFAFISRLMEEAGYFYFFQHSGDGHELVITDSNIAFQPIPDPDLIFDPDVKRYDALSILHAWKATATGTVTLDDYDPSGVDKPLPGTVSTILTTSGVDSRAIYHFPALAYESGEVATRARRRIEAAEAFAALTEGEGWNEGFVPGGSFTLAEDPFTGQRDATFAIRSVEHHATNPYQWGADARDGDPTYTNRFSAFPSAATWRQPLTVPRPRMAGLYSAVVIGPPGEEIFHDKLARVKVQFPWSHLGDTTAGGALWVRVIKSWAGGGWGTQFIPRIGTEVAVAFIDGDPDRPIVTGALYNAGSDPLYDPSQKNKTGWRSRSTPGGGSSNYSEFTMDDSIGAERVFLHAERDHIIEVEHNQDLTVDNCRLVNVKVDEQRTIGQNQTTKIGLNESFTVGNNTTRTIGNDYLTKVGSNRTATIGTDDTLQVGSNRSTTIGTDHLVKIGANQTTAIGSSNTLKIGAGQATTVAAGDSLQVGSNQILKIGGGQSLTIGSGQSVTIGAGQVVQVGSGHSLTATSGDIGLNADTGNIALNATAGAIGLTAPQMISLSCGPSSIALTPMGVSITGLSVSIDGVFVSAMSVLWSVLGVLAMVQGALVTINSGASPGSAAGGAVEAADDAEDVASDALAVAGSAVKADSAAASDMEAAVIKAADAAIQRSGFLGSAAKAVGSALGKVAARASSAYDDVADALTAAKAGISKAADSPGETLLSGAKTALAGAKQEGGKIWDQGLERYALDKIGPTVGEKLDTPLSYTAMGVEAGREYEKHEGEDSLDNTNTAQANTDDDPDNADATVNLSAARQASQSSGGASPSPGQQPPRGSPGNNAQGNNAQGNNAQGNNAQGNNAQGNNAQGNNAQGNNAQGNNPQGNNAQGSKSSGNNPAGNNPAGNKPPGKGKGQS